MNADQIVKAIGLGIGGLGVVGIFYVGRAVSKLTKRFDSRMCDTTYAINSIRERYLIETSSKRRNAEDYMASITNRALDILDQNTEVEVTRGNAED